MGYEGVLGEFLYMVEEVDPIMVAHRKWQVNQQFLPLLLYWIFFVFQCLKYQKEVIHEGLWRWNITVTSVNRMTNKDHIKSHKVTDHGGMDWELIWKPRMEVEHYCDDCEYRSTNKDHIKSHKETDHECLK